MTDDEWATLISTACAARPTPIPLVTYRNWMSDTWAFPAAFADANGVDYFVKSPRLGPDWARALVTEQVVSALGRATGAPVAEVRLVELPQELLDINQPDLEHFQAGVCHGSLQVRNAEESRFLHVDRSENRPRFASLAALYGWVVASDHQFLYGLAPPYHVHSHDHGMFLPGQCGWTREKLDAAMAGAGCDTTIVMGCQLSDDELRPALARVQGVVPAEIAAAVALPPDDWGVTPADRLALAKFLAARQAELATRISHG